MKVAIIPARGGSKRIPGKNVRDFCGQPIIKYSIDAAARSKIFDRVIVSTDCDTVAAVSKQLGAEVPFRRPRELADDHTPTLPVIRHAVEALREGGDKVKFACCLYATAPFVRSDDLIAGYRILESNRDGEFSVPVTTFPFPIFRGFKIEQERIKMIWPEHLETRSQDLLEAWHDAGQFYWGTAQAWRTANGIFSADCLPIRIPRWRVQDIDSEEDWLRAEILYESLSKRDSL